MREASHMFSTKNIGIFEILTFELTNDVVSFEQPGPVLYIKLTKISPNKAYAVIRPNKLDSNATVCMFSY